MSRFPNIAAISKDKMAAAAARNEMYLKTPAPGKFMKRSR